MVFLQKKYFFLFSPSLQFPKKENLPLITIVPASYLEGGEDPWIIFFAFFAK